MFYFCWKEFGCVTEWKHKMCTIIQTGPEHYHFIQSDNFHCSTIEKAKNLKLDSKLNIFHYCVILAAISVWR